MSVVQQQKHKGARLWKAALPSHRHGSSAQPLHTFTLCWRQHTQGCKGTCIKIKTCLFFFFGQIIFYAELSSDWIHTAAASVNAMENTVS